MNNRGFEKHPNSPKTSSLLTYLRRMVGQYVALPVTINTLKSIPYLEDIEDRASQISKRLSPTRDRLRQLRNSISKAWSKLNKHQLETAPSAFPRCDANQTELSPVVATRLSTSCPSLDVHITIPKFIMDGTTDKLFRRTQVAPTRVANVSAIFVHAGAGYHSTTNEHIHLSACDGYVPDFIYLPWCGTR